MLSDRDKVSELWSACHERRRAPGREAWSYAIDHPRLRAGLYDTYLTGLDPISWMRARMPVPAHHALEIGCGSGNLAFGLFDAGTCERIDAFDVAEGAIVAAQARARDRGLRALRFHLLDGNTWSIPRNQYDFVYASHALHHIDNLEHLFAQAARALRPGGVMFASDYIGPSRMQYSDAHVAVMNEALATLPESKRLYRSGLLKAKVERLPIALYLQNDPSEAVRSAEIIPVMRRFFDVDVVPMGMSLSFEVLLEIVHNFDPDDPGDNALIDGIVALERRAERTGQAEPLFACLVARHKGAPPWTPPPRPEPDFATLLAGVPTPVTDPDQFRSIEGGMPDEAVDLTSRLFHLQRALRAVGGVLELGVSEGKYLGLLASLAQDAKVPVIGTGTFASRAGEQTPMGDRTLARDAATAAVMASAPGSMPPTILVVPAAGLQAGILEGLSPAGYSFISVNAGRSAADVARNLAVVEQVLGERTVVAADGAFNAQAPGVMEGLCRHFLDQPGRKLAPFAYAGDKLFLCPRAMHPTYLAYAHWLLRDPAAPRYIAKSAVAHARNQDSGHVPLLFGFEIFAFEWT